MRSGAIILTDKHGLIKGENTVQLIDFVSKKQSRVCRSTYAAELYSALALIGLAININVGLTEVLSGVRSATQLADIMEEGKNVIELDCLIDARSVLDSVSAEEVKTPNDKIMLLHALKLREHLDRKQLSRLVWIDTRDMLADGLNKGSISRDALKMLMMQSVVRIVHDTMTFSSSSRMLKGDESEIQSRQPESKCTWAESTALLDCPTCTCSCNAPFLSTCIRAVIRVMLIFSCIFQPKGPSLEPSLAAASPGKELDEHTLPCCFCFPLLLCELICCHVVLLCVWLQHMCVYRSCTLRLYWTPF